MRSLSRREMVGAGFATVLGARTMPEYARSKTVLVWSEGTAPGSIYPHDINHAIADGLAGMRGWTVRTASIDDPDQGVPDSTRAEVDAIVWWGHRRHDEVADRVVNLIARGVREHGLGFVPTHSAHWSRPFKALMGTDCGWGGGYNEDGSRLDVSLTSPRHPVAHGIRAFVVPHTERYTEPFHTPQPDTVVFDGTYTRPDGTTERSRQGLAWQLEAGRVFYFQPGHESYPIYFQPEIRAVLRNAVRWTAAAARRGT